MPWWRKLLALLGLTEDARVRVRAPGIEVTLTGNAELVRSVLSVVKSEIARHNTKKRLEARGEGPKAGVAPAPAPAPAASRRAAPPPTAALGETQSDSQIVLPSELDEMDSPYAIPEHHAAPADEDSAESATPIETAAIRNAEVSHRHEDTPEREVTVADAKSVGGGLKAHLLPQVTETEVPARTMTPRAPSRVKEVPGRDDS